MASPGLSEIVTTTLQNYSGTLADNILENNALLNRLNKRGNKKPVTGRSIVQELMYAENSTVKWYSGYETLDISPSDTLTAAEYDYKQLAGTVSISGLEQIQNSGKEAVHNLLRSRIQVLEKSLMNTMGAAVYANGTGSSGKEVGGLQLLIADDPTASSTIGGINQQSQTWWRNQVYDFSVAGTAASNTTIQAAMNTLFLRTMRGADKVDFIAADEVYFSYYWESLQQIQRITRVDEGQAGFMSLKFMSADVFYDDQCPASHMYFVNTDYLFLRPARGREFVPLSEREAINQDAMVKPVVWAGNMTTSNRSLQGVIHA